MTIEPKTAASPTVGAPTVSHMLGEMVWLLTRSPLHRSLSLSDLEWLIMPALLHEQFYMFRDGDQPIGLALWAKCTPEAAAKFEAGMLEPHNRLTLEEWKGGDQIWLVDLVAPFATAENQHREIMMADLIAKPLRGLDFSLHRTDPATGMRSVHVIDADAFSQLERAIKDAAQH